MYNRCLATLLFLTLGPVAAAQPVAAPAVAPAAPTVAAPVAAPAPAPEAPAAPIAAAPEALPPGVVAQRRFGAWLISRTDADKLEVSDDEGSTRHPSASPLLDGWALDHAEGAPSPLACLGTAAEGRIELSYGLLPTVAEEGKPAGERERGKLVLSWDANVAVAEARRGRAAGERTAAQATRTLYETNIPVEQATAGGAWLASSLTVLPGQSHADQPLPGLVPRVELRWSCVSSRSAPKKLSLSGDSTLTRFWAQRLYRAADDLIRRDEPK